VLLSSSSLICFFFHVPPTPEFSTLSLHDALPILVNGVSDFQPDYLSFRVTVKMLPGSQWQVQRIMQGRVLNSMNDAGVTTPYPRSEEHTSELQSRFDLVCRLLLEKKNTTIEIII